MERAAVLPFIFLLFCCCCCFSMAQTPIPAKYDGFAYKGAPIWGDSVLVEAFFDPMCPDSRDSWPPLKHALEYYTPHLSLIVHPFPLPYHGNSYVACRALHIANKLNTSSTYPLLELFFEYQEKYYNAPTLHKSRASIIGEIAQLAAPAVGKSLLPAFKAGYNDSKTDTASRISFKYGCSRGVTGTPFFFVNGIPLPDYGSAINYKKWRSIIDPLLAKQRE